MASGADDPQNDVFAVTPCYLEILVKGLCMCKYPGESGRDLSGVADEIKTPATGKVRAIDNWKYWHGHRGLWAGLGPDG